MAQGVAILQFSLQIYVITVALYCCFADTDVTDVFEIISLPKLRIPYKVNMTILTDR